MIDKFQAGDRVFAKIKGWPPWPAKVLNRAEGKAEAYLIQFYGTYDTSVVKPDGMFVYNDESKAKYGKPKNSSRWKEAIDEIENNTPIGDSGPLEEEETEEVVVKEEVKVEAEPDTDNDGELMIDEGPAAQPPVLTKEVSQNGGGGKAEQPKGRRGSKASLSKRDSIASTSSIPEVTTPAQSASTTEMVSRSGRKIKPKRFADDEIPSPPVHAGKKSSVDEGSEGPPTKRAKRGPKTPPVSKAQVPEPKDVVPSRARMVIGKGKGAPGKLTPTASGRLSPDISSPMPKAPALKPAGAAAAAPRKSEPPPMKKALPALIPAAAGSAANTNQQQGASPTTRRAPTLKQQPLKQDHVTDEESETDVPPELGIGTEEAETDDKENVKDSTTASSNGSEMEMESESEMEKNSEMDETSSRYSETIEETKIQFNDKEGQPFELRVETKQDFESEEDRNAYETSLGIIAKFKEDLEQGDQETHETIQEIFENTKEDFDPEEAAARERRALQIRTLRMEGEVIEIIGEIVSCLSEKQADCVRAIELLERLASHDLTALILKKHPEVVNTCGRLRNYVGNVEAWDMTEEQAHDFKDLAQAIREKAAEIYDSFYSVFISPEERDASVSFEDIFTEEMKVFKEMTQDYTLDEVLGLTAEVQGGFECYDASENEV